MDLQNRKAKAPMTSEEMWAKIDENLRVSERNIKIACGFVAITVILTIVRIVRLVM